MSVLALGRRRAPRSSGATARARTSSWGANASLYTVATVVLSLGNYGYSFLIVHLMSAREFARFSAAQGLMLVLGSGCMAAIPWAMARFIAERGDRRAKQEAMHFGLLASALQGLVFAIVAGGILWLEAGAGVGIMVGVSALSGSLIAVPVGFLQGVDRIRAITGLRVLEFVVRLTSGLVILLLVSRSAPAALIGYPVGAVVLAGAGLALCRSGLPPVGGEGETIRALARQAGSLGAIQVFLAMLGALDTVAALAAHMGPGVTASYQSAALLGRIPLFLSAAIGLAAYVHVVDARGDGAVREKMAQAIRLYALVAVPFVIACLTVPGSLVHVLIPARYGDAGALLRFTAVSGVAVGWIDIVSTAHQARGRFRPAIRILGAAAVAQPILLICAGATAGIWLFAATLVAVSLTAAVLLAWDARAWVAGCLSLRAAALAGGVLALAVLLRGDVPAWIAAMIVLGVVCLRLRGGATPPAVVPDSSSDADRRPEAAPEPPSSREPASEPVPMPEPGDVPLAPRVLIIGDSVACGLGVYGESFGKIAAAELGAAEVLDVTGISKSVGETLAAEADRIRAFAPELAILACGTTESLVHPGPLVQRTIERWGPSAWNGVAGLEPRPYFSGNRRRRLRQRVVSALKVTIKRATIRLGGGRRISVAEYQQRLTCLIALLEGLDCPMVFVGMSRVDEHLFPGTGAALADTQAALADELRGRRHVALIDPNAVLDYWDDFLRDRLHLADAGHRRIAAQVVLASRSVMASARSAGVTILG